MPIFRAPVDEDEVDLQCRLVSILAYPAEYDGRSRTQYFAALHALRRQEKLPEISSPQFSVLKRGRARVFRRCVVAKVATEALELVRSGQAENELNAAAQKAMSELRKATQLPNQDDGTVWETIWRQSAPVVTLAEPVHEIMASSETVPEFFAMIPGWGSKAAIRAEILFFDLAEMPIFGFDHSKAWRVVPKDYTEGTVTPLNGGPERVLFASPPRRLELPFSAEPIQKQSERLRDRAQPLYKRREPYFVKPVRFSDDVPEFDWQYGATALRAGVVPSIMPDANILFRMKEFMQKFSEWGEFEGSGLDEIFRKLKTGPAGLFFPYPAFVECGADAYVPTRRAVNFLFSKFAPEMLDEEPWDGSPFKPSISDPPSGTPFWQLDEPMQFLTGPAYLIFLRTPLIERQCGYLPPEGRFYFLMNYLSVRANLIPGIEVEISKHYFFKRDRYYGEYGKISKTIKENFFKRGKDASEMRANAMNAARDIVYARAVANYSAEKNDTWLLTNDAGIDALFRAIYWKATSFGVASNELKAVEWDVRMKERYWNMVDAISAVCAEERKSDGIKPSGLDQIRWCISETELEIEKKFPKLPPIEDT